VVDRPPHIPPYTTEADANASASPVLDALVRLDDLGVELVSDGRRVWFADPDARRKVPRDLHAVVRECGHTLAMMMGDTRGAVA
jgi:hypothetical protein